VKLSTGFVDKAVQNMLISCGQERLKNWLDLSPVKAIVDNYPSPVIAEVDVVDKNKDKRSNPESPTANSQQPTANSRLLTKEVCQVGARKHRRAPKTALQAARRGWARAE
jgi:hypothetical protein